MDLLGILGAAFCSLDFVRPWYALGREAVTGPAHVFGVPDNCGLAGVDVTRLLRDQGVTTYGLMWARGHFIFSVPRSQARAAQRVLDQNGIPTTNPAR